MGLSELRSAMSAYAARFDPTRVPAADATRVVEDAAAIEKMASTVKSLAAARVAETTLWKRDGDLSAAHHLARTTGTPVGQAREALESARRLQGLPATEAAARRGELSAHQLAVITDAASADPGAEARLLKQAHSGSYGELRDECARTKANVSDLEERRRRIHRQRYLRTWSDTEGAALLQMRDNPEVVAGIMATIEPIRDELADNARQDGRRERVDAHAADALAELAHRADRTRADANRSRRARVLVRVDLPALLRGYPTGDETCELAGYGPVAVSALRDLIDTEDPFLAAVVTAAENVVGVAHLGRRPNAHQQTALEWLYPTCAVEGCNHLTYLETDHRDDWAATHTTVFGLLDRFCGHHHDLKTRQNWALVEGCGKRAFVPPDDPRHPRNANAPPAAA
jgi:Domain of unknown function (DUF222)